MSRFGWAGDVRLGKVGRTLESQHTRMPLDVLQSQCRDYRRIAQVINLIRSRVSEQPSLSEIATHFELSEGHLHRLFSRWAGLSPKRFLQHLTIADAKCRLACAADLMGLALDSGLSGPGRLHDLFVTLEAMTPGESKRAGAGLEIRFGIPSSPFGQCLIAFTARGVCLLQFGDDLSIRGTREVLRNAWPNAALIPDAEGSADLLDRVFVRPAQARNNGLALWVKGTNFQVQVWRALLAIPPGAVTTYRHIAVALGRPQAARAVGNAVAANPIAYLIPCHRVIRQSGDFGKYHWGSDRKAAMLVREAGGA